MKRADPGPGIERTLVERVFHAEDTPYSPTTPKKEDLTQARVEDGRNRINVEDTMNEMMRVVYKWEVKVERPGFGNIYPDYEPYVEDFDTQNQAVDFYRDLIGGMTALGLDFKAERVAPYSVERDLGAEADFRLLVGTWSVIALLATPGEVKISWARVVAEELDPEPADPFEFKDLIDFVETLDETDCENVITAATDRIESIADVTLADVIALPDEPSYVYFESLGIAAAVRFFDKETTEFNLPSKKSPAETLIEAHRYMLQIEDAYDRENVGADKPEADSDFTFLHEKWSYAQEIFDLMVESVDIHIKPF